MDGKFPEQMKCPVCFEIPEKEIFQCKNGHTLCDVCAQSISLCPQCRVQLGSNKIRSRALEDLLDMMTFDCKYKSKGCSKKVSRGTSVPFCEYVGYKCDHRIKTRAVQESIQHLCRNHHYIFKNTSEISMLFKDFTTLEGRERIIWQPVILQSFDKNIALITQSAEKHVSFTCILIGSEVTQTLRVEFCIMSASEKDPSLEWTTTPIPFTQAEAVLQFQPFHLSLDFLNKCYLKKRDLIVNVVVYKQNLGRKASTNKLVIEIGKAMIFPLTKSLNPASNLQPRQSTHNSAVFDRSTCDVCQVRPIRGVLYRCLECEDYDLCKPCKKNGEHSCHNFSIITTAQQHILILTKTHIPGATRWIPYVQSLQKPLHIDWTLALAYNKGIQETLKCRKCDRKPDYICLFCRDNFGLCTLHFVSEAPKHEISHFFAISITEQARNFVLTLLRQATLA